MMDEYTPPLKSNNSQKCISSKIHIIIIMDVGVIILYSIHLLVCMCVCVCVSRACGGYRGDVWEWHVSVIDDDIVPAFPRRPFRRHFI